MMAKVDPYLRPLYDALYDMLDAEGAQRMLERGTVEVAPLAFMRGRTLNGSFIILDEAQNTTPEQIDLQGGRSGLLELEPILSDIDGLEWVKLTAGDVVRHRIVQDIVSAYENAPKP
jgi:phosphate starvation-inducible PhoH-like protein